MTIEWLHEARSDDGQRFRIGRRGHTWIAEWDGLLRLEAEAGREPRIEARSESLTVGKLRQGAVPALLGHLEGPLHWHASACAWGSGPAVLFLGDAGAGKSTLVAGLCAHTGAAFLGDDVAAIAPEATGFWVRRREDRHALRSDMAASLFGHESPAKSLFDTTDARDRAPLGMIVSLSVGDTLALRPLAMRRKVQVLTHNLVRFALDDGARLQRDLDLVMALVAEVPVYSLVCPRPLSAWGEVARLLGAGLRGDLVPGP